jgi:hypothetical protein
MQMTIYWSKHETEGTIKCRKVLEVTNYREISYTILYNILLTNFRENRSEISVLHDNQYLYRQVWLFLL